MAGKIRVYELARELGLTNKEMLDLCAGLGIGVKSHSSSIEEAQADRARRKAEREGLRRDVQPEEPGVPKRMPPRRLGVPESVGTGQERVLSVTGEEHLEASAVRGSSASRPPMSASAPGEPSEPGLAGSLEAQTSGPQLEGELDAQLSTAESQRVEGGRGASELAGAEAGSPLEAPPFGAGTEASPSGSAAERKEPIPGSPQQPTGRLRPAMPPPRPAAGGPTRPPAPTTPPPGPRSSPGQPAPSVLPPPPVGRGQAIPPPPPRSPRPAGQQPSGSGRPVPGSGRPAGPGGPPRPAGGPPQPSESRPAPGGEAPSRPAAAAGPGGPGAPPRGAGGAGAPSGPRAGAASGAGPATPGAPSRGTGAPGGPKPPAAPPRGAGGRPIPPPPGVMRSASGRPIPPPPGGPPRSASGKPIPPPPGLGGRGPQSCASRPGGGGGGRPAGAGGGAGRPGGGGGGRPGGYTAGRPGGGQFPRSSVPGAGVGRGAPGGGPSGRGSPGAGRPRPQQRRPRRRRRSFEELSPTELTTYSPSSAPVPEGEIVVERGISAQELGPKLNRTAADVVRFLFQMGEMVTATQSLTDDMIELFAQELGAEVLLVDPGQQQELQLQEMLSEDEEEDEGNLRPRPPVITVMGHVDHGKTLLLDRIREANVVAGEAGGITQHIGSYQVTKDAKLITFIDTPGHQAFTAMRARGAEVTDIVVLVVAADDGVMPQTIEAINHAKAAEVPIIVAINKVDRDNADPNRVKQQLAEQGLVPEEWGGDTIMVEISALHNLGIDDLLDQLLVVAELEELVANPEGRARGVVLEANLDVGRGPVATVLVEKGTLQVGAPIVAGAAWGRVRALIDDNGDQVKEALPSTPVQVLGLSAVPSAGDEFRVAPDDRTARTVAEARERRYRERALKTAPGVTGGARLEDIFEQIQRGETATLNLILKADVHGSLEAATESLKKLERDEVKLAFVHRAVGGITEYDIQLAAASNATIIGFNVRPDRRARELAEAHDVEIRTYEIIYKLLEDIEAAMVGMLAPEYEEVVAGDAEVREVFSVPRVGKIAGCYVQNGTIARGAKVRFLREGTIIWKGTITSLKRFKDDVREVQAGFECGIGLSDFQDLKPGDIIETYEEREIPRS